MFFRVFRLFINKYTVVTAGFAIWMLFFDTNDYQSQREREQELEDTKQDIAFLNQEIAQMEADYQALIKDPKVLERYAREHYRMKRDTEDLYVVERK